MTNAANNASSAATHARRARNYSDDEAIKELARALEYLAQAVADLSRQVQVK